MLTSVVSIHADNHANFEKAKKNKDMAIFFFDKLLTEPEAVRPILHKDFSFLVSQDFFKASCETRKY